MADIQVFFVTNRNYVPENKRAVFGGHFNPDGVAALRFGHATFSTASGKPVMRDVTVYPEAPAETKPDFKVKGSDPFLDDIKARMAGGAVDTLVFIHGFNVSFMDALGQAARVALEMPATVNVVLFSWPSDGTLVPYMSYYSDRDDARASGAALARTYLKLFDFVACLPEEQHCQRNLHVLAHSMGNYVLRNGLQSLRAKDPRKLVRMFDQVILAAPDEDDDAFESDDKLRLLPGLARRVTLYYNHNDRALIISDKTKANPDRLGSDGPRMVDLLPKKVILVDCSRIASVADKWIQHSYYINDPSTAADIGAVLAGQEDSAIANREVIRPERAYRLIK